MLYTAGRQRVVDANGDPVSNSKLYFYLSGTSTPAEVYSDSELNTPLTQPVRSNSAGFYPPIYLDESVVYKTVETTSGDVALPGGTVDPANPIAISQSIIAQLLNPQTAEESAAGATIVNNVYPPGCVDRYGINTVPGTTDMTAAFNAAFAVAKQFGCEVTWGATAPYRLNSAVNCTGLRGTVVRDISGRNSSAGQVSVIIAHTGHGFDLSHANETHWYDVAASNLSGTVPNTLFFIARNSVGSGAEFHRFDNIRTPSACTFRNVFYTYGSEGNTYLNCVIYNAHPGGICFNHTATNTSSFTSSFVTIATGAQSNSEQRHIGGNYFQLGNSGSTNEVVFQLEGAPNFSFRDGLWACPYGLAYIRIVGDALSCYNFCTDSIRGEPTASDLPTYGINVVSTNTTGVNSHVDWHIVNSLFATDSYGIYLADTAAIVGMHVDTTRSTSGDLLSAYNLSRAVIQHGANAVQGRAGGTVSNCTFTGSRSEVGLLGTDSLNTGFDQALGEYWSTEDRYTAPSTACTGAITTASTYKVIKTGQQVTLTLLAVSGTASAATSFTLGTALPVLYRPTGNVWQLCAINNNGSTVNQPGFVLVNASTGAISVFRDLTGTNFTAAAAAGLPADVTVSWRL